MYFYDPPYIFWGAWNSLSGLLPKVTREKLVMLYPGEQGKLVEDIGSEVLPKDYGGGADYMSLDKAVECFKLRHHSDSKPDLS